ncbi:hypothetical protein D3C83_167630 [compost metagenome]
MRQSGFIAFVNEAIVRAVESVLIVNGTAIFSQRMAIFAVSVVISGISKLIHSMCGAASGFTLTRRTSFAAS